MSKDYILWDIEIQQTNLVWNIKLIQSENTIWDSIH